MGVGYPQKGVVFWFEREETYNLNRPSVVVALIRYALQNGWSPDSENRPIRWSNGTELLTLSQAPSDLSRTDPNVGRFWVPRSEIQ